MFVILHFFVLKKLAAVVIMPLNAQFVGNFQRFRLVTFDVTDTLLRLNDQWDNIYKEQRQMESPAWTDPKWNPAFASNSNG